MRFTAKGDAVYAILLGAPDGTVLTLEGIAPADGARVELLGRGPQRWRREGEDLRIELGAPLPSAPAHAFRVRGIA